MIFDLCKFQDCKKSTRICFCRCKLQTKLKRPVKCSTEQQLHSDKVLVEKVEPEDGDDDSEDGDFFRNLMEQEKEVENKQDQNPNE